ncbi:MAG TPA: cation:proton antiporter [Burkholderiales bacterium]|nr:cation:proton antiporter [Burkholderiales bacterium]
MSFAVWCLIVGLVLLAMALAGSVLKRLPLSASMLYLAAGFGLGPIGLGLLEADPFGQSRLFERLAEIAVLISLFVAGLKLSVPLRSARWFLPLRLAIVSMLLTIVLITAAGMWALGLPLGAAVLLGAILAPTDPVLASDVQLTNPADRDRLRFSLTGEAGLNDGVAFPFVMLGLGLLGLHELGAAGWKWLAIDVVWGIGAGLAAGGVLGFLTSRLVVYLRVRHREAVGLDEFLALGLIALSYGVALLMHTWGFLAVFAAGLAFRRVEAQPGDRTALHSALHDASIELGGKEIAANEAVATDPRHASSYMTQAVLGFNEQLERVGEVALVIILGAMLAYTPLPGTVLWFLPLLFLVIRPASVWAAVRGLPCSRLQLGMMSWFGIRGVGSIYYLMFAINHGLPRPLAEQLAAITLAVVATSIVVHGISVTPLMRYYEREERPRGGA